MPRSRATSPDSAVAHQAELEVAFTVERLGVHPALAGRVARTQQQQVSRERLSRVDLDHVADEHVGPAVQRVGPTIASGRSSGRMGIYSYRERPVHLLRRISAFSPSSAERTSTCWSFVCWSALCRPMSSRASSTMSQPMMNMSDIHVLGTPLVI